MTGYLSHFFGIGIPAMLIFACFGPYRRRALRAQGLYSSPLREGLLHGFVLCLFGLAAMVLWPDHHFESTDGMWGNLVIHNGREYWNENMNLIPLRMVTNYLRAFRAGLFSYFIIQFFGNMGTFLPLGFFPGLLFRGFGGMKTFLFGLSFSLGAECCQFFLGRRCDVDDVILNVVGVMLGYLLRGIISRYYADFAQKALCQNR